MTEQAVSPKEVLVKLIKSFACAEVSGDEILRRFAQENLSNMLNRYDLVELPQVEPTNEEGPAAA
jgi:hypothetical protein